MELYLGDCLEEMKKIPDGSVDLVLTDPPYELGFMGKSWDSTGIANNVDVWKECLRVLKPGGYLLSFGGTRTYHRMASAIEDAGFEVRDMIEWVYGSGFPKSLNIGKVADKFLKTGNASWNGTGDSSNGALGYSKLQHKQDYRPEDYSNRHQNKDKITEEKAKQWEGWGTALKPAHEPICMARKPLAEKTVAENCLKYGTGGINIDESRVDSGDSDGLYRKPSTPNKTSVQMNMSQTVGTITDNYLQGRFPANLIHDNSEEVRECFPNESERFFKSCIYQAKASKSERNKGCEELEEKERIDYGGFHSEKGLIENNRNPENRKPTTNNHPTVKPLELMSYLIKMVTPKGGIVLDPFAGSGSTLVAAKQNGYQYIGIEMTEEYIPIIEARLKSENNLFNI